MQNPGQSPHQRQPKLKRLVLLEDIVGSGTQCLPAIQWAIANLGISALFVPLILYPKGAD